MHRPFGFQASEAEEEIQHSLFGEILDWMLAPLLLLWPMSIAITYLVAKSIANQPFDHALEETVIALTQQMQQVQHVQQIQQADGTALARLSGSARDILRSDDVDNIYFQIAGVHGEYIGGDRDLPALADDDNAQVGIVHFRNASMHGTELRIAYTLVEASHFASHPPRPDKDGASGQATSAPPLALVQIGETMGKRAQLANEIIKGVILPQFIILPIALALVWFALARGLSPLAQLQQRIRARPPDDLSPIESGQTPEEISPLVGSLNDLLARLSQSIQMQKRFIADAAHQMKTPLAGMRMQSELALRQTDSHEIHRSLEQLAKSSESATHLVNQLLALARAENQPQAGKPLALLDLSELARSTVHDWVQMSFARRIDLGFEAPEHAIMMAGNPLMLRELLSNLIDNALRYTPSGGSVTVRVRLNDTQAVLEVEDTGPGIPPVERGRVFERFYRILGNNAEGSGLGLAIVREIALQHEAEVDIFNNPRSLGHKNPGCLFRVGFRLHTANAPPLEAPED